LSWLLALIILCQLVLRWRCILQAINEILHFALSHPKCLCFVTKDITSGIFDPLSKLSDLCRSLLVELLGTNSIGERPLRTV